VKISAVLLSTLVSLGACALTQAQSVVSSSTNQLPAYRVNVVSRTTPAMNYGHRGDATKINFKGTDLMPSASGVATVQSKRGATKISAEFEGLSKPTSFGTEYLTYILWAISPEGRAANLGEVLLGKGNNNRSKVEVTTDLQAFALIVTAEPYYAVRRPSNVVIAENSIRHDTVGTSEAVEAKYELIDRGGYIPTGYHFDPVVLNAKLPLEFFEARNALRIASSEGAEHYASESYQKAASQMKRADEMATNKHSNKKSLISVSREAVQTADDAREIAVKRIDDDRLAAEKAASAAQLANATAQAANATTQATNANAQAANANAQAADATAKSKEDLQARKNAEAATAAAQLQQMDTQAESERNRLAAAKAGEQLRQAVRDREELRARLLQQFNAILITRDTVRGLVVNMSDVLFDTGKFTLRPLAREKLAKISGIVLAYPDLRLAIEGNTDSVGTDAMNQDLSERRAAAVRDYLAMQRIPTTSMTSQGFGKTQPVASNDTTEGRQQNRRVELVVSGDVIGTTIGVVSQATPTNP
jgi:outer membrane protein OmpA-like peptidoglycan-associated protein